MAQNERKTEQLVRNQLRNLGYFNDENFIIEEQKSDSGTIANLLSKASKTGNGAGYPEFIITQKNSDVLIVVECKADVKFHESDKKDKPKDYAVDGVLHYAYVACGRASGAVTVNRDIFPEIAGELLVREAGGRVTDFQGGKLNLESVGVVYSNSLIHENLLEVTNQYQNKIIS